jgi:excisionase family DNA binding protein
MTIDWSDTTLRTLGELAATAFPVEAGITKDTLKRRIRQGKLVAYRPGKAFLSSYADVHAMIESLRVKQKTAPLRLHPKPTLPPGITEADLASRALDHALEDARKRRKARELEKRSVKRKRIQ